MSSTFSSPGREKSQPESAEGKTEWMNDVFDKHPELSVYREKLLPLASGYSFANAVFTDTVQDISVANRYEILNLVSQHLRSVGLNYTADVLSQETGYKFFNPPSPDWETTDLRMLVSLSLGLRDSPWDEVTELNHKFMPEEHEEDYNASQYTEDPSLIWEEYFDPDINTVYLSEVHKDFAHLGASTLRRAVVLITKTKFLLDDDLHKFFLSLHSVTSSEHFFDILMHMFYLKGKHPKKDEMTHEEVKQLREGIINILRKWLYFHGLFIGKKTINAIELFLKEITNKEEFAELNRYTTKIIEWLPSITYGQKQFQILQPNITPIIPNPAVILSIDLKFFDPDPTEVARQVTLLAHDVFCSIHSMEFITAFSKENLSAFSTPTLNEFNLFNQRITFHVLETLVYSDNIVETYSRALEICQKLQEMHNFGTLSAFLAALDKSECKELCKSKENSEKIAKLKQSSVNYEEALRDLPGTETAIPNMQAEIKTQLEIVQSEKMPQYKNGLINWERVRRLSERPSMMYRLQNTKYLFYPIVQIQKVIKNGPQHTEREINMKLDQLIKDKKSKPI